MFTIRFVQALEYRSIGRLAEAELVFETGPLEGLKLVGFQVWESRTRRTVTFPARQYSANGERRSFALLRPDTDPSRQDYLRDVILEAYATYEKEAAAGGAGEGTHAR
jgi:hypothetical protein